MSEDEDERAAERAADDARRKAEPVALVRLLVAVRSSEREQLGGRIDGRVPSEVLATVLDLGATLDDAPDLVELTVTATTADAMRAATRTTLAALAARDAPQSAGYRDAGPGTSATRDGLHLLALAMVVRGVPAAEPVRGRDAARARIEEILPAIRRDVLLTQTLWIPSDPARAFTEDALRESFPELVLTRS